MFQYRIQQIQETCPIIYGYIYPFHFLVQADFGKLFQKQLYPRIFFCSEIYLQTFKVFVTLRQCFYYACNQDYFSITRRVVLKLRYVATPTQMRVRLQSFKSSLQNFLMICSQLFRTISGCNIHLWSFTTFCVNLRRLLLVYFVQ